MTKVSVLADRLNTKSYQSSNHNLDCLQQSFPILLKFLVRELLKHAQDAMPILRVNKYSSFVLQVGFRDSLISVFLVKMFQYFTKEICYVFRGI